MVTPEVLTGTYFSEKLPLLQRLRTANEFSLWRFSLQSLAIEHCHTLICKFTYFSFISFFDPKIAQNEAAREINLI